MEMGIEMQHAPLAVMCASEAIHGNQVELIEKAFRCPVHVQYGQSEKVCMAVTTRNSRLYHIFPQYGLTELVDEQGEEVSEDGKSGEIVATSFHNFAMPLIRYRTGDIATQSNARSSDGFHFRKFSNIAGRRQDLLMTADGRLVSVAMMNMHDDTYLNIRQFQYSQTKPGLVVIKVIPCKSFSSLDADRLRNRLTERFGGFVQIVVETVEELPRTQRGKLRIVDQRIELSRVV